MKHGDFGASPAQPTLPRSETLSRSSRLIRRTEDGVPSRSALQRNLRPGKPCSSGNLVPPDQCN